MLAKVGQFTRPPCSLQCGSIMGSHFADGETEVRLLRWLSHSVDHTAIRGTAPSVPDPDVS